MKQTEVSQKTIIRISEVKKELKVIADNIDKHARLGYPFSLTFFYNKEVLLTNEQKKILEEYLEYNFRTIWANTWLHIESDNIRKATGIKPKWARSKTKGGTK